MPRFLAVAAVVAAAVVALAIVAVVRSGGSGAKTIQTVGGDEIKSRKTYFRLFYGVA